MKKKIKMECKENECEIDTWQYLSEQIAETENRLARISALREVNLNASNVRPDDTYFLTLDSTLKKNSAFVRKLKSFCARQLDSLLQEMNTLNLTKYLGEVAGAIVESKIKMGDIPSASRFCSVMHQHYSEFSALLLESWTRIFSTDSSKWHQNETKMKINIVLYSEMIVTGVLTNEESFALLERVLVTIMKPDMEEHVNVNIIMTFCKHCGYDFAGLIPRSIQHLAIIYNKIIPTSSIIRKEKQMYIRALLKEYHVTLCKHLIRLHRKLLRVVREEKRIYKLKGEVDVEEKKETNELLLSFQNVHKNCMELGEYLSEDSPLFLHDELSWIEEIKLEDEEEFSSELWEDEESQHFYEHFPNIKYIVASFPLHSPKYHDEKPEKENDEVLELEEILFPRNMNIKVQFKVFLENLPKCVNRELIDNSSVNFAMSYNTKWNRKQLVQSLLTVPRTRIDLLPFYSRMVATLNPTMPDIAKDLEAQLLKEFRYLCRNKCQLNIESKLKVVIFMGELVKFRVFSAAEALGCLKWLIFNFSYPHHIKMFCSLMDTCGKFLFRQPEYHQRVKIYLEDMMQKKAVWSLDPRYTTMMENTYFQVNPPERQTSTQKNRPIMHEFIRKLLYKDLSRSCTESIVKSMRRLDWRSQDVADYAVKCLTNATNVKYHNIRYLAEVVCGLSYYQELAGIKVVDSVMEDIRLGMELNLAEHNQSRLTMVKYLGELHNYYLVETDEVLNVLYSFITFGVDGLEPHPGLFRVRLTCMLLNTAGPYMGADGQLDVYLAFLQDFFWSVGGHSPPAAVVHLLQDTLQGLRPDLRITRCPEEARAAVRDHWQELVRRRRDQALDDIPEQDDQGIMPQVTANNRPSKNVEDNTGESPRERERDDRNLLRDEEHMTDETSPTDRKSSTDGKSPVEQNIATDNKYPTDRKIQINGKFKSKMFGQDRYYETPSTNIKYQADEQCIASQSSTDNESCNAQGAPPQSNKGDGDILKKEHLVDEKPSTYRKSTTEGKTPPTVHKIAINNKYTTDRNGQMHGKFKSQIIRKNYNYGRYLMNERYQSYAKDGSPKRSSPMVSRMSSAPDVNQKRDSCVAVGNTPCGSTEPAGHSKDEKKKTTRNMLSVLDNLQSQLENMDQSNSQRNTNN